MYVTLAKTINEIAKFKFLDKRGILINIDIGKNHRFCLRRFWGKSRNGYCYEKSYSVWDDGLKAIFRRLTIHNISFDFITWDRTSQSVGDGIRQ